MTKRAGVSLDLWPPHKDTARKRIVDGREVLYWVSSRPGERLIWTASWGPHEWLVWLFDPADTVETIEELVVYSFRQHYPLDAGGVIRPW
jgi:hypothetical protein